MTLEASSVIFDSLSGSSLKQWQSEKNGKSLTEEEIKEYQDIQESLKRTRFSERRS